MTRLGMAILAFVIWPALLHAQARKPMTAELVTYAGQDREQVLYAGAKTEGKVTWYTSLAGESYKAMVKAFEGKYPGKSGSLPGLRLRHDNENVRGIQGQKTYR